MSNDLRRPAVRSDCTGCESEHFFGPDGRECWSFTSARVVPVWVATTESVTTRDAFVPEQRPHCYHRKLFVYVTAIPEDAA